MPVEQTNITLGTAGHIDHGKTALVKLLTGCETDRLREEKERGMSIDLGFAPCKIADTEVGIVDVPGHERFIKTMVAGASGMDGVILVVAADDGVMPQTREHLEIITLLGVEHGVVALTKIDRVAPEQVERIRAQIAGFLKGTFLEGAQILPVSSVTGEGFGPFYEALTALAQSIKPKTVEGVFRLPVERTFSVRGYGTVVTGIPVSGSTRVGEEVILLPQGEEGRINSIQVYNRSSDAAVAGQCAALQVRHWDHSVITRGNMVASPGYFAPEKLYACKLRLLRYGSFSLKSGTRIKFHTGTSEVPATIYLMKADRLRAGEEELIQVRLEEPLVAGPGDHYVLRTLSPVRTVGGGTIIEATPKRLRRNRPGAYEDLRERGKAVLNEGDFIEYSVKNAESFVASDADISYRCKLPASRVKEILDELLRAGKVVNVEPGAYMHRETAQDLEKRVLKILGDFHRTSPESPGIAFEHLEESSGLERAVLKGVLAGLKKGRVVEERGPRLALAGHREIFSEEDRKNIDRMESLFRERPFNPPSPEDVAEKVGASREEGERLAHILVEQDRLVEVTPKLIFHRDAVDRARDILVAHIRKEGKLESVKFKYLLDTTRKFAIPLLDYFDRVRVTRRVGNTRYLMERRGGKS